MRVAGGDFLARQQHAWLNRVNSISVWLDTHFLASGGSTRTSEKEGAGRGRVIRAGRVLALMWLAGG